MSKTRRPKYRDDRFDGDSADGPRSPGWEPRRSWADLDWREEERARDGDRRRNEDRGRFPGPDPGDMEWDTSDLDEEIIDDEEEE